MNVDSVRDDLEFVKRVVERASHRVDAQAFHCVHWGILVLVWYPIANWAQLEGAWPLYIGVGIGALVVGFALSAWRGARASRSPRLPGGNRFVERQLAWIAFANIAAGALLSGVGPATGFIDGPNVPIVWGLVYANLAFMTGVAYGVDFMVSGIVIFVGCVLAMVWSDYNGFILGPFMGIGMIVPGIRAERRVQALRLQADAG